MLLRTLRVAKMRLMRWKLGVGPLPDLVESGPYFRHLTRVALVRATDAKDGTENPRACRRGYPAVPTLSAAERLDVPSKVTYEKDRLVSRCGIKDRAD